MFIFISSVFIALTMVMIYNQHKRYKFYASCAREWIEFNQKAFIRQQTLHRITPNTDYWLTRKKEILNLNNEDISRVNGYINHYRSKIPRQLRSIYKCP